MLKLVSLLRKGHNMLNRTPPSKNTTSVINSYRKRRLQKGPFLVYGAVALVIIGAIMLVVWLASPGKPLGAMFATDTPTATLTATVTITPKSDRSHVVL